MDMQERVFYAAARAQLMAAKAKWSRAGHPADRSDANALRTNAVHSRVPANRTDPSKQDAFDHRYEMAKARCAVQMIYAKRFEESQHPRAPAGRADGGQFVKGNGAADTDSYYITTLLNRLQVARQLAQSDSDQLTLAELTAKLQGHLRAAKGAATAEIRARERAAAEQVQQVLTARNFSDDNAPLAVKERIWKAHQRYQVLFYEYRRAEDALASWKRLVPKDSKVTPIFEQRLAAVRAEMQELAKVTGARLPEDNPIRDWSFEQKFARTAQIALESGELTPEVAAQLMALIEPANLARTAAMMATLGIAHQYPVAGLAADALLLTYVGTDGALVAYRLYLEIDSIQSEADLHSAAKVLNQEIAAQASGKLIQLLTWGSNKRAGAFNKRFKIALDRAKVKRLSNGVKRNPAHLAPFKFEPRTKASLPKRDSFLKRMPSEGISKPGFGQPGAAEWRYRRYLGNKRKNKAKHLPFDQWKSRHFDPAASGGRPGRRGGPIQVKARKLLEAEGFENVENVKLGGKYPDMVRDNGKGGKDYVEVGVMLKSRKPQAREYRKLVKEVEALGPNDTITFVDKNNLSNRITYRCGDVLE